MKRHIWFWNYFTKSKIMQSLYYILLAHGAAQVLMLFKVPQQKILLWLMVFIIPIVCISVFNFARKLWWFSGTDQYPSHAFTYVFLEAILNVAMGLVLGYASFQALSKYGVQAPLTWQGVTFVYALSISTWLFYVMSRVVNKKPNIGDN